MTKGLLAVILPVFIITVFLVLRSWKQSGQSVTGEVGQMLDPGCIIMFVLITVPWHILAFRQYQLRAR